MYPDRRHAHVLPRGSRRIRRRPGRDLQFEQPRRLAAARLGEDRRTGRDGTRLCGLGQQQGDFGDLLRQGGDRLAARIGRSRNRRADRIGRVQPAFRRERPADLPPRPYAPARCSLRPSPLHGRNHLLPRRRPVRTGRHRPTYAPGEPLPQPPAVPADHPGSAQSPGDPLHPLRVRRPQGLGDHRQADERRPLPRRIRPPVDQKPVGHLPVRRGMQDAAGLRGTHPALVRQMGPETVGNAPPYAPRRFDRAYPLYLLPLEPHHVRPAHIPRGFRGPDSRPVGLRPLHRREGRFPGRETQPAPRIGGVLRAEFQTVASGAGACRRAVRRSGQRFARHHAEARNAARAALVHRRIARPFHHAGQRLLCGNRLAGPRSPLSRARLGHAARQRALPARPRLDGAPVHPADAAAGAVVRRT